MVDCLDHIRNTAPDVFKDMKYTIIEISEALATGQRARAKARGLDSHVEIVREDFFSWKGGETGLCYVVALEVLVSSRFPVGNGKLMGFRTTSLMT
jgi:hypothetical protein